MTPTPNNMSTVELSSPYVTDDKALLPKDIKMGKFSPAVAEPEHKKSRWQSFKKMCSHAEFKYIKLVQIICGIYILVVTFTYAGALGKFGGARDPKTGFIIDPNDTNNTENGIMVFTKPAPRYGDPDIVFNRAIIASTTAQMVLLGLSRFSGYFMYPAIICVFWTKYRGLQAFIDKTPLSVFCISDTHRLHVYCGWIILLDGLCHTTAHCIRWALQGNLFKLLLGHPSGITGLIVITSTFIIVFPMTLLRRKIKFEIRKYAHYLFWLWCIAMAFHAPKHAIPNGGFCAYIFPLLIITYGVDATYVKFYMSERINTVDYKLLNSGVQLTMPVSKRFQGQILSGGYGYIMFPWVNKRQWHAFSLYENPSKPEIRHMFLAKTGDWTSEVHRKIDMNTNTTRPVWISGPFPSPYNNAINFDNMILVASGIGITPALSAIEANRDSRRINLIWAVREASMLTFFLENARFDEKGLNLIFYTGKEALPSNIENIYDDTEEYPHVKIIKERPNLSYIIPNIMEFVDRSGNLWREEGSNDYGYDNDGTGMTSRPSFSSNISADGIMKSPRTMKKERRDSNQNTAIESLRATAMAAVFARKLKAKTAASTKSSKSSSSLSTSKLSKSSNRLPEPDDSMDRTPSINKGTNDIIYEDEESGNNNQFYDIEASSLIRQSTISTKASSFTQSQSFSQTTQQGDDDDDSSDEESDEGWEPEEPADEEWLRPLVSRKSSQLVRTSSVVRSSWMSTTTQDDLAGGVKDTWRASLIPEVWKKNLSTDTRHYVKKVMEEEHLETWGLLFCGGRNKLLQMLVTESKDLDIPLHEEAFDW